MVFNFTVANVLNICNRWLIHISAVHTKIKKTEQQKAAVHIGFWKLCMTAMHVETVFYFIKISYVLTELYESFSIWCCFYIKKEPFPVKTTVKLAGVVP